MRNVLLAASAVLVLAGCAVRSDITRASSRTFPAKDPGCNVEFFRTQRPAVPYDEIAAIHLSGGVIHGPDDAQQALRSKACELGADAVIVTDEIYQVPNVGLRVTGTAVAYRGAPPAATPPERESVVADGGTSAP